MPILKYDKNQKQEAIYNLGHKAIQLLELVFCYDCDKHDKKKQYLQNAI